MKDTGYACVFANDGKPGVCGKIADWLMDKEYGLCEFHAGFMRSVDYYNEHKFKRLTTEASAK